MPPSGDPAEPPSTRRHRQRRARPPHVTLRLVLSALTLLFSTVYALPDAPQGTPGKAALTRTLGTLGVLLSGLAVPDLPPAPFTLRPPTEAHLPAPQARSVPAAPQRRVLTCVRLLEGR